MKEVTICFCFSVKDGQQNYLSRSLGIPVGWSIDGIKNTEKHKSVLIDALLLLEELRLAKHDLYIRSITLGERILPNTPDDLKTKNSAHAKGELKL